MITMKQLNPDLINKNINLFKFEEFLYNTEMVLKTCSICNIPAKSIENIKGTYTNGFDQSGAIYQMTNSINGKSNNIIIDIINRKYNSYDQLLGVIFGHERINCEYKIIMFNDSPKGNFPLEYEEVLGDFIDYFNKHRLNIYQARIKPHFFIDLSHIECKSEPKKEVEFNPSSLPGLEQFLKVEFWQLYYYPKTRFHPMNESEKVGNYLFDKGYKVQYQVWETFFEWGDRGAFFRIKEAMKNCINFNETIANSMNEIRSYFDDTQIKIVNSQENPELIIELNDIPDRLFSCLSEAEKQNLTEVIMDDLECIEHCMAVLEAEGRPVEYQEEK